MLSTVAGHGVCLEVVMNVCLPPLPGGAPYTFRACFIFSQRCIAEHRGAQHDRASAALFEHSAHAGGFQIKVLKNKMFSTGIGSFPDRDLALSLRSLR